MMISELTQEQKDQFPRCVEKWVGIGTATDPIDLTLATEAISLLYTSGGLKPPRVIYCKSPAEADRLINKMDSSGGGYSKRSPTIEGQHFAHFGAFYGYFRDVLGLEKETEKAAGLFAVIQTCGWVYCYSEVCFVCDRHSKLNRDENGRLHCEDDYAFQYPDGWGSCFWHGHRVPTWCILEKEKLTSSVILKEENKELQRCMMDIYGRDKLIKETGKFISSDDWGTLYRIPGVLDGRGRPIMLLEVVNSSPNEEVYLSKAEIDNIILKAQQTVGYNGMQRHGDVLMVGKNVTIPTREEAELKIKQFRQIVSQEIDLIMAKKNVRSGPQYKKYYLQVEPHFTSAYAAWQSVHTKTGVTAFLPFVAS